MKFSYQSLLLVLLLYTNATFATTVERKEFKPPLNQPNVPYKVIVGQPKNEVIQHQFIVALNQAGGDSYWTDGAAPCIMVGIYSYTGGYHAFGHVDSNGTGTQPPTDNFLDEQLAGISNQQFKLDTKVLIILGTANDQILVNSIKEKLKEKLGINDTAFMISQKQAMSSLFTANNNSATLWGGAMATPNSKLIKMTDGVSYKYALKYSEQNCVSTTNICE